MFVRIVAIGVLIGALGACAMETRSIVASDAAAGSTASEAQLMTTARAACQSYGLAPYTERFERCVRNEYAYRVQG
jgi:hypothetical protein